MTKTDKIKAAVTALIALLALLLFSESSGKDSLTTVSGEITEAIKQTPEIAMVFGLTDERPDFV